MGLGGFVERMVLDRGRADVLPVVRPEVRPHHGEVLPRDVVAQLLGVGQPGEAEEGGELGLFGRGAIRQGVPAGLDAIVDLLLGGGRGEPADVVGMGIGVGADEVAGVRLLAHQLRIGVGVPAHQEIGRSQAVLGQDPQEQRRDLGTGPVIDGEGDVLGAEAGRALVLHAAIGGWTARARLHLDPDLGCDQRRQGIGRAFRLGRGLANRKRQAGGERRGEHQTAQHAPQSLR